MSDSQTEVESQNAEPDHGPPDQCTDMGDGGRRCEAPPLPGHDVCANHTPEVKAEVRRRWAEKQATRCGYKDDLGVCLRMPSAEGRCELHTSAALDRRAHMIHEREAKILAERTPRVVALEKKISALERVKAAVEGELRGTQSLVAEERHQLHQVRGAVKQSKAELQRTTAQINAQQAKMQAALVDAAQKGPALFARSVDILSQTEISADQRALADSLRESAKECRLLLDFAERRQRRD